MNHAPRLNAIVRSKTPFAIFSLLIFCFSYFVSAQTIAGGNYFSLVLCSDGTVRAFGSNVSGQLGDSTNEDRNVPVLVKGLSGVIAIAAEGNHSIALKSDSTVWGWGANFYGQIGDSTNVNRNVPVKVVGLTGVIAIAAGDHHSLALKKDGTVWAWGWDFFGQLGSAVGQSNVPVKIDSLSGVTAISAGAYHSVALKTNGTMWAWGNNTAGELGIENTSPQNYPQQVSGLTSIKSISGTAANSYAIKNDGTLWVWGSNTYFQLGNNTEPLSTFPRQVNGIPGVSVLTGGFQHSLALKNDGTVWAWGNNSSGQLGNGAIDSSSVYVHQPTQVQGISGVAALTGGGTHTLAVKNDGTVWAWGYNLYGQLGNGTNTEFYTTPVKVSGTWSALTNVAANNIHPTGFTLEQNFPNPFNPSTTIQYALPEAGNVVVKVYDVLGKEVAVLVHEYKEAGRHQTNFDASHLSSGMYFYMLTSEKLTQVKKMLLVK